MYIKFRNNTIIEYYVKDKNLKRDIIEWRNIKIEQVVDIFLYIMMRKKYQVNNC